MVGPPPFIVVAPQGSLEALLPGRQVAVS